MGDGSVTLGPPTGHRPRARWASPLHEGLAQRHALERLHAAHPEPVGSLVPFVRPEVLLSLIESDDAFFTARVELSGVETTGHLRELMRTVASTSS